MRLIIHQALKDVRALGWPLVAWLVLIVADTAAQALGVDRLVIGLDEAGRLVSGLTVVGNVLAAWGVMMAVMVVQADALDSPDAFWLTRPLSPLVLMAGKLLVIVPLFLVLPALLAAVVVAANGATGPVLLRFVGTRLFVDLALVLPFVVAGATTHNLQRQVLVAVAGFALYIFAHLAVGPSLIRAGGARDAGLVPAALLAIGSSLALLAHQYLTRRTRRSMYLGAAAVVLVTLVGDLWPWPLPFVTGEATGPAMTAGIDADAVTIAAGPSTVSVAASSGQQPLASIAASARVSGLPSGIMLRLVSGDGEVRFESGQAAVVRTRVVSPPLSASGSFLQPDALVTGGNAALEAALDARLISPGPTPLALRLHLFSLSERDVKRQQMVAWTYTGRRRFEAVRFVTSAAVPLVAGATATLDGRQVTVLRGNASTDPVVVREARAGLGSSFAPLFKILRNRRRGEAYLLDGQVPSSRDFPLGLRVADVDTWRTSLWPPDEAPFGRAWLADAELVLATFESLGTFERRIVIGADRLPEGPVR